MALNQTVGGNGSLFVGEDKAFILECLDASGNPIDMTAWPILFTIRRTDKAADPAIFQVTPTLTGVFNPARASNTQRSVAILTAAQMETVKAGKYRQSWKRMDPGSETVLEYGDFVVEIATNY